MNAEQVCARLSKAIQAVELWLEAQKQYPAEAAAAAEMFTKCYPERRNLITSIGKQQ